MPISILKKKRVWISLTGAALVAGVLAFSYAAKDKYAFVPLKRGPMAEAIYGLGKVKTHKSYEVKIGVMSKIQRTYVDEGDAVKAGAPLIKFSDFDLIKAPFAGTVTRLDRKEPEIVFPNMPVLVLEDLRDRYIEVSLEQEGALRVRKGQKARVLFESLRGIVYEGRVDSIFPKEDEFLAHIEIPELSPNVLPGMTADTVITVSSRQNALLIPIAAVVNGLALIEREGKKMKVPVAIGGVDGQWAEVLEGELEVGDKALIKKGGP